MEHELTIPWRYKKKVRKGRFPTCFKMTSLLHLIGEGLVLVRLFFRQLYSFRNGTLIGRLFFLFSKMLSSYVLHEL